MPSRAASTGRPAPSGQPRTHWTASANPQTHEDNHLRETSCQVPIEQYFTKPFPTNITELLRETECDSLSRRKFARTPRIYRTSKIAVDHGQCFVALGTTGATWRTPKWCLFWDTKNFFRDTETFFGDTKCFFSGNKSFWLTKIPEHHKLQKNKKMKNKKKQRFSGIFYFISFL